MLTENDFDEGILKMAIRAYAKNRGIGYEEAKHDMKHYKAVNPVTRRS